MTVFSRESQDFLTRNRNKKIVFTNGCFDILHVGHATYLQEARGLGDLLFVGLNSDLSVKKLKGPQRPVNGERDRKFLLESLRWVDFVEIFSEETPLQLIQYVRPDFLVKGGDWPISSIVGAPFVQSYGGQVKNLGFVEGKSTSQIIDLIKKEFS